MAFKKAAEIFGGFVNIQKKLLIAFREYFENMCTGSLMLANDSKSSELLPH
jgi:hypothetical protein